MNQLAIKDMTIGRRMEVVQGGSGHGEQLKRWGIDLISPVRQEFVVTVTPDDARWVLKHMHPGQRQLSHSHWGVFAEMMDPEVDTFLPRQEPGICWDRQGNAVNARHRLMAQEKMDRTYEWRLSIGLTSEEVAALDQTRPRRIHQSINLVGDTRMTAREEAAIKTILDLRKGVESHVRWRLDDVLRARESFSEALEWALSFPVKIGPAALLGAMAFAYPVNPVRVREFGDQLRALRLREGGTFGEDHPVLALVRSMDSKVKYGTDYKFKLANRALYCLMRHTQGQTMSRISDVKVRRGRDYFAAERRRLGID